MGYLGNFNNECLNKYDINLKQNYTYIFLHID
jgi:hypothetical protein